MTMILVTTFAIDFYWTFTSTIRIDNQISKKTREQGNKGTKNKQANKGFYYKQENKQTSNQTGKKQKTDHQKRTDKNPVNDVLKNDTEPMSNNLRRTWLKSAAKELRCWDQDTVVKNTQEWGRKYWATRSFVRSFARTAQSFTRSALLVLLTRSAWLICLLTYSFPSLWDSE